MLSLLFVALLACASTAQAQVSRNDTGVFRSLDHALLRLLILMASAVLLRLHHSLVFVHPHTSAFGCKMGHSLACGHIELLELFPR